ncbi:MAG: TonB-dependent receptor, partial [Bacteroidota bacterium]
MRKLLIVWTLVLCTCQLFAQRPGNSRGQDVPPYLEIKGRVLDEGSGQPLAYATISLYAMRDSSLVTGGITDDLGVFTIKSRPGRFHVNIQSISYELKSISEVALNPQTAPLDLGDIKLAQDVKTLDEVVVQAEKSQMELSLDKRVFNIGKDLSNLGGTAADILDNLPSVEVDIEGNVSLRGSDNVQILVDGKPSGLVGINGSSALRQLQGSIIEKVEVITNPSSRYDAEGMGGIINIVLKKDKEKGVNGAFELTTGYPHFHGASANVNFRRKWVNFFINYGVNYRETPGVGLAEQQFFLRDSTYFTDRTTDRIRGGFSNNIRTGMDLFINEKNSITMSLLYRRSDEDNEGTIIYRDLDEDLNLINVTTRTDLETELDQNLEYNLNYKKTFNNSDHILTADFQYRESEENAGSDFVEQYSNEQPNLQQRSANDQSNRNILTQADYIYPFGNKGKVEAGYRGTLRTINNQYLVEEFIDDEWVTLEGFSNTFVYDENIYAFYAMVGNKINRYSYQVGLRTETTDITTDLKETNEINDKNYTDFFPSAFLTYDLKNQSSLQLSYSRRLRRPRFWDLNPFFTFSDARNIRTGNPDLDPEYTDSYEFGYLKTFENSSLYAGIYYRHSTGVIQRISEVDEDGITYTFPVNLSTRDSYGLEVNGSLEASDWWTINGNFNFFSSATTGSFNDQDFDFSNYAWSTRLI